MQSLPRFLLDWAKHRYKGLVRPDYRYEYQELTRLRALPRYQPTETEMLGIPLELVDSASFLFMYEEIFEQQIYRFRTNTETPYIIDGGANIGLSTLYFKRIYPMSKVVAFEPDDKIFSVLQRNIQRWGHKDIELLCRALWSSETSLSFMAEGADGGRVATSSDSGNKTVRTIRLRDYLDRRVDFLKLDIEGAETEVLLDCVDLLGNVEHAFIEYHSFVGSPQTLHTITGILSDAGFRLHIHPPVISPQPFLHRNVNLGMDMQLNIFAFRA